MQVQMLLQNPDSHGTPGWPGSHSSPGSNTPLPHVGRVIVVVVVLVVGVVVLVPMLVVLVVVGGRHAPSGVHPSPTLVGAVVPQVSPLHAPIFTTPLAFPLQHTSTRERPQVDCFKYRRTNCSRQRPLRALGSAPFARLM